MKKHGDTKCVKVQGQRSSQSLIQMGAAKKNKKSKVDHMLLWTREKVVRSARVNFHLSFLSSRVIFVTAHEWQVDNTHTHTLEESSDPLTFPCSLASLFHESGAE